MMRSKKMPLLAAFAGIFLLVAAVSASTEESAPDSAEGRMFSDTDLPRQSAAGVGLGMRLLRVSDIVTQSLFRLEDFRADFIALQSEGEIGKKDVNEWIARDIRTLDRYVGALKSQLSFIKMDIDSWGPMERVGFGTREVSYGFRTSKGIPEPETFGRRVLFRHLHAIETNFEKTDTLLAEFAGELQESMDITPTDFRVINLNFGLLNEYFTTFRTELGELKEFLKFTPEDEDPYGSYYESYSFEHDPSHYAFGEYSCSFMEYDSFSCEKQEK